jgi:putative membrane protein
MIPSDANPTAEIEDDAHRQVSESTAELVAGEVKRLHPLTLIFDTLTNIRRAIIPLAFGSYSIMRASSLGGTLTIGVFVVGIFVTTLFRYFSVRYQIAENDLIVDEGIISRKHRTIPVQRIQNIDLKQTLLHRLFKVAEVRVETASGTEPEATLRVLSMTDIDALRRSIFAIRNKSSVKETAAEDSEALTSSPRSVDHAVESERKPEILLGIPMKQLLVAGLLSNRGFVFVGIGIGLFFQFMPDDFSIRDRLRSLDNDIPAAINADVISKFGLPIVVAFGVAIGLMFLKSLSVAWYILRFSGYRLQIDGDDLQVRCGLFTQVSATVPRRRIQFISIHRGFMQRWFSLGSIRIETAGGAGGNNEDASASVGRRWFIPIIAESEIPRIVHRLRPEFEWNETEFDWKPLAPNAKNRLRRIGLVVATLLTTAVAVLIRPWGWISFAAFVPLAWMYASRKARSMRYARDGSRIVYRSGVLVRKCSITFLDKTQTVSITQSPFDRRWSMATLSVDTAAAGPAQHRIDVPMLSDSFAESEYETIAALASQKQLQWN